jgi:hypothetical protein
LQTHVYEGSKLRGDEIGPALWREADALGVTLLPRTVAWGLFEDRTLGLAIGHGTEQECGQLLQADAVLIATGAIDRFSVFPGSTLPGVVTATAAVTMLHGWRVRPGRRALVLGDDPITALITRYAQDGGMETVALSESDGLYAEAGADGTLGRVVSANGQSHDVDTLILAQGMQPANDLARMVDCEMAYREALGGWVPLRDATMRTSIAWLFVAGDAAGVADARTAMLQGQAAGAVAADVLGKAAEMATHTAPAIDVDAFRPVAASDWDAARLMEQIQ